jgi:hypothetical protein
MVLFKTHIIFFYSFASASQRPFCSLCEFLPLAIRLATFVAGVQGEENGCGDRVSEWMSAGQQSNFSWWCGAF